MDMDHGTIERLFWQQMRAWTVKSVGMAKQGGESMLDLEEVSDYADKVALTLQQSNLIEPDEVGSYAHFIRRTSL